ncbi:MAG: ATP-binding protein [Planctomycetota bacterium]|nr:ATP-binding protein [Planctomycetota bacterium]
MALILLVGVEWLAKSFSRQRLLVFFSDSPMDSFIRGLLLGCLSSGLIVVAIVLIARRRNLGRRPRIARTIRRIRAISSRRAARLREQADRVAKLAEIGTLTGGLAHEIKNPLSTIQLNLQLLQEELDPRDPAHTRLIHRLGTVGREASRLRDILDDFLRFAGKIELRREPVDLNKILEELGDFFEPQAQINQIRLRLRPNPAPLVALVDPRLIKQAVLNLMLNGCQAMNRGGELILTASASNGAATIDVIDTGPGIPRAESEKIFDAYYSTKKGGTGLGLAMSRRIVEEHGGEIGVRSEVGKGSDFFIRLPTDGAAPSRLA